MTDHTEAPDRARRIEEGSEAARSHLHNLMLMLKSNPNRPILAGELADFLATVHDDLIAQIRLLQK